MARVREEFGIFAVMPEFEEGIRRKEKDERDQRKEWVWL